MAAVRSLAYWPDLVKPPSFKSSAAAHIDACAHCIAKQVVLEEHGLGIDTVRRGKVLQLDHLVLTDEEALLAGCIGSLQIIDVATRVGVFCAADSQSAEETAWLLMVHWIPYYGVPDMLITDPHSGFASDIMKEIRRIVGIREHDKAAARAKGKVAIVERSNELLRSVLDDGFAKGDIHDKMIFMMYLSFGMQKRNFIQKPGRRAYIELWCGQLVGTMRQLATVKEEKGVPDEMKGKQTEFMTRLQGMVDDFVKQEFAGRDEEARKNALRRDKNDQKTKAVDLKITEGDVVSHEGIQWNVEVLHGEIGHPVTATIVSVKGDKQKRVKVKELRRMATALPVKMLPKEMHVDDFVLWKDEDGYRCGGTVEKISDEMLEVLAREQDDGTGKNWFATWIAPDCEVKRRRICPEGMKKNITMVERGFIDVVGELTDKDRVTDATWRAMKSVNAV